MGHWSFIRDGSDIFIKLYYIRVNKLIGFIVKRCAISKLFTDRSFYILRIIMDPGKNNNELGTDTYGTSALIFADQFLHSVPFWWNIEKKIF